MNKLQLTFQPLVLSHPAGAQQNGDVRLRDGSPYTGRVEVYMESEWGTVQYDSTYDQEGVARTICTQLGYGDQTSYGTVEDLKYAS